MATRLWLYIRMKWWRWKLAPTNEKGPVVTGPRCGICVPLDQADVTRPPLVSTDLTGTCFMPAPM